MLLRIFSMLSLSAPSALGLAVSALATALLRSSLTDLSSTKELKIN